MTVLLRLNNQQPNTSVFRQFYVLNSQSLLKGATCSQFLAIAIIALEHCQIFSLLITESCFKGSNEVRIAFVYTTLAVNTILVAAITILFMQFIVMPFEGRSLRSLSFTLINYNSIFTTQVIQACAIEFTRYNATLRVQCFLCFLSTLILSFISSLHTGDSYSLINQDSLGKQGNIWDRLKFILLCGGIALIEIQSVQSFYWLTIAAWSAMNIINELMMNNSFFSQISSQVFLSLNILLLIGSVTINKTLEQKSALLILVASPLIWNLSGKLTEIYSKNIFCQIRRIQDHSQKNSKSLSSQRIIYLMNYFTHLLVKESRTYLNKIGMVQSAFRQYYQRQLKYPSSDENQIQNTSLGDQLGQQLFHEGNYMKDQLIQLQVALNELREKDFLITQSQQVSSISTMPYLFYLLEIEKNHMQLAIKCQELMHDSGKNIFQQSLISYIEQEIDRYAYNEQIFNAYKEDPLDLGIVMIFQDDLQELIKQVNFAIHLKAVFLQDVSKDRLNLVDIENTCSELISKIFKIATTIINLKNRSINSQELEAVSAIFLDCLWIDPFDKQLRFLQKTAQVVGKSLPLKSFQKTVEKLNFNLHSSSCSLFVCLKHPHFGIINKASNSCNQITGYSSSELLGKNCNILIPTAIAVNHNQIIRKGIDKGFTNFIEIQPMLTMKRKDGSVSHIKIEFQLYSLGSLCESSEIGMIAKLSIKEETKSECFMLVEVASDKTLQIETVSLNLFQLFFSELLQFPSKVQGIQLRQIFPVLNDIISYCEQVKQDCFQLESLAFFPKPNNSFNKTRLFDTSLSLVECFNQNFFSIFNNDIYQVQLRVTLFRRETFTFIQIHINNATQVLEQSQITAIVQTSLIKQLTNYLAINPYDIQNIHQTFMMQKKQFGQMQNENCIQNQYNPLAYQNAKDATQVNEQLFRKVKTPLSDNLFEEMNPQSYTLPYQLLVSPKMMQSQESERKNQIFLLDSTTLSPLLEYKRESSILKVKLSLSEQTKEINLRETSQSKEIYFNSTMKTEVKRRNAVTRENYKQLLIEGTSTQIKTKDKTKNQSGFIPSKDKQLLVSNEKLSSSPRYFLLNQLYQQSLTALQITLIFFVLLSFIVVLIISCQSFSSLQDQITSHSLNSLFYWWLDKFYIETIQVIRYDQVNYSIKLSESRGLKTSAQISYQAIIPNLIKSTLQKLQNQLIDFNKYDYCDLDLTRLLFETQVDLSVYSSITQVAKIVKYSYYQTILFIKYWRQQVINSIDYQIKIADFQLLNTDIQIFNVFLLVQQQQKQIQENRISEINLIVQLTLITIFTISIFVIVFIFYLYSMKQREKEQILSLFAFIEQESIISMYKSIIKGKQLLQIVKYKSKQESENYSKCQEKLREQLPKISLKKRKINPTTSLPKTNRKLIFQMVMFLITINFQPLANIFLIKQQIKETNSQQQLVKQLFSELTGISFEIYSMYRHFMILMDPSSSQMPKSHFELYFKKSQSLVSDGIQTITESIDTLISEESQQQITTSYLAKMFTSNTCDTLQQTNPIYFGNNTFNFTSCNLCYGSVFQKGYIQAVQAFSIQFGSYLDVIILASNSTSRQNLGLSGFFIKNDVLEIATFAELISIVTDVTFNILSEQKNNLYADISIFQSLLFSLQIFFIILLFMAVIIPFFKAIKIETSKTIHLLSILQIQQMLENPYITTFIKIKEDKRKQCCM